MGFALIGAAAMAFRGVSRATVDVDLLTVDRGALESGAWAALRAEGIEVEVRRGDHQDPLAGVVRCSRTGDRSVDLVVGKGPWQAEVVERATPGSFASVSLPVVEVADLVLLKLHAGGPQDAWDIHQLLAGEGSAALVEAVEGRLQDLEQDSREFWRRILRER